MALKNTKYTINDLKKLYNFIPGNITTIDYENILNDLFLKISSNNLGNCNLNNEINFLKSKIIEKVFCKIYDFQDNTLINCYDIDCINKNLHLLVEIKINPDKYGKNGNTYNGLISNDKEFLSFYENKIKDYINILKNYTLYDFYICIFSESENIFYFINFYDLYDLYLNKHFEQFITKDNKKSSLFFDKKCFMNQNDFNYILKIKNNISVFLNNNVHKIKTIQDYIKCTLLKMKLYGLDINYDIIKNIYVGEIKHYNNIKQITISDQYINNVKDFLIYKEINKKPIYYFNNKIINNNDLFKIMKTI